MTGARNSEDNLWFRGRGSRWLKIINKTLIMAKWINESDRYFLSFFSIPRQKWPNDIEGPMHPSKKNVNTHPEITIDTFQDSLNKNLSKIGFNSCDLYTKWINLLLFQSHILGNQLFLKDICLPYLTPLLTISTLEYATYWVTNTKYSLLPQIYSVTVTFKTPGNYFVILLWFKGFYLSKHVLRFYI